jgi:hypothetical protein
VLGRLPWMPGSLVLVGNAGIYAKQFVRNTASRATQKRHSRTIVDERKAGARIEVELRFLILWILRGPGTHRPALANQVGRTAPRAVISAHKPWEHFRLRRTLLTLTSTRAPCTYFRPWPVQHDVPAPGAGEFTAQSDRT